MSDAEISVVGNVTRDPELKYLPSGQAVVRVGIAVNRRWRANTDDEWKEEVSFFTIEAWGTLAENVAASVTKGSRVLAKGRIQQRSYEKDGEKRSAVEIVADSLGPDLRWATAEITRIERTDAQGTTRTPPAGPSQRKQQEKAAASVDLYDEEPF